MKNNLISPHPVHDHDRGLQHDLNLLTRMTGRRQALRFLLGASLIPIIGCGGSDDSSSSGGTGGSCATIPEETEGPYPGDGSNQNGTNALTLSGIVRSDIRSSLGSATGVAAGVPLTLNLTLVNNGCTPLAGYAIYVWHCNRDGSYSMYTIPTENYLRGVQETDSSGTVSFTTIFPACYSGRWPHIHFEVYPSLAKATAAGNKLKTSQLALPQDICNVVFATTGYSASVSNLAQTSLSSDMVFSDGATEQIPTVTGSVAEGYVANLKFGIAS